MNFGATAHALCTYPTLHTYGIFLLSFYPSTVALPLRKPTSASTSHVSCHGEGNALRHSMNMYTYAHVYTCLWFTVYPY